MIKKRLIPVLLLKNGLIVRSERFKYHQIIGDPTTQLERYNHWNVDELIYLDISRGDAYDVGRNDARMATRGKKNLPDIIDEISKVCFVPLTFGGRVRSIADIGERLEKGCDKIAINTIAIENPLFITLAANHFGSQCVVISIDVKKHDDGHYEVFKSGVMPTGLEPVSWAKKVAELGAGEILLNSVDRDGMANGYDIEMVDAVASQVGIPVVALGGCGSWKHVAACMSRTRVSATAVANKFHFTEMAYPQAKQYLKKNELPVRCVGQRSIRDLPGEQ